MTREAELERSVAVLNAELIARATPRVAELMDSIHNLTMRARQGDTGALTVLRDFTAALDEARAVASGIELARRGPNGV